MAQESLVPAVTVKPAHVVLQVLAPPSFKERNDAVRGFYDLLAQLELAAPGNLTVFEDKQNSDHLIGVKMVLLQPEAATTVVKGIGDRMKELYAELRLTISIGAVYVQVQTTSPEELLTILPALDTLLPAQQLFQARAEAYALQGGEFSPVEVENLELLRYRLNLDTEVADRIKARALGPYIDRQTKLQKYRAVLAAEQARQSPLSEATWTELRRFYQTLGLTPEDVAPMDAEFKEQAEADATRRAEEEAAKDAQTRLLEVTYLETAAAEKAAVEQQTNQAAYRQEFQTAIAQTLHPTEFNQGRLAQMRHFWALDPETVEAIERAVTDEQYGPIDSNAGLDYSRLRQLLWLQQWEAADQETERLMLSAFEGRDMRPLDADLILRLDRVDVQTLDALWTRYSQGKFGFRRQHQVYVQQERRADEFLVAVGWQNSMGIGSVSLLTRRKPYRELTFDLDAPVGHLPTWRWGVDALEGDYSVSEMIVDAFFLHLERCIPTLDKAPPADTEDDD